MSVVSLITKEIIKTPLESTSKNDVIAELLKLLVETGKVEKEAEVYSALLSREALCSTGFERGIAMPHAKSAAVKELCLAIGISPKGLDFEALDEQPSHFFFLLLAPEDQAAKHVEAMSELARLMQSNAFCRMLKNATTPEEVLELFFED